MYRAKTPRIIQSMGKRVIWRIPTLQTVLYLTFDDGPDPDVTPRVLKLLAAFNAKATFFCVGNNARRYPEVLKEVIQYGHQVANHSYKHESGFETPDYTYYKSFLTAKKHVESTLYRPPYGRITPAQVKALSVKTKIIMWDVLSGDFDKSISWQKCTDNVINNARAGSIIVFHDSAKAASRMLPALEKVLEYYSEKGFTFEAIDPNLINRDREK